MPRQDSHRGLPISSAVFEAPFETNLTRFGIKGLNLIDAIDVVEADEMTRLINLTHRQDGGATTRAGQLVLNGAAIGTNHHSVRRLNDPLNGTNFTRVHGVDTSIYMGTAGPQGGAIDSGYSGNPLSLLQYRPPFSAETWMFVGDSARMRKVRTDGLSLPIGIAAPSAVATTALTAKKTVTIADFLTDGTQNFGACVGLTYDNPPTSIFGSFSTSLDIPDGPTESGHFTANDHLLNVGGPVQHITTHTGYYEFWGVPKTMDLSTYGGGVAASDDDYIHLWLNFSHVDLISEFRVYLVCSSNFLQCVIPGTSITNVQSAPDTTGANSDAYFHTFSGNDFAQYVSTQISQLDASETARLRDVRNQNLTDVAKKQGVQSQIDAMATAAGDPRYTQAQRDAILARQATLKAALIDPSKTQTAQQIPGSNQWMEFGVVGVPIRRGDFQRIGTTAGRDWSTITGIICLVKTAALPDGSVETTEVRMGGLYMHGGSYPDTGEPDAIPYDYRYTHYDSRTGAESNPSPIMASANFVDTLRRSVVVTPTAYGDAAVVQRIYRRGGSLPTDWFFLGANTSDGGAFTDNIPDTDAAASNTLEIDNNQPVPTVDASGNTVLAQPVPALWGPLNDLLFACGDPHRPGVVYFCKPGEPDSWPPTSYVEVCAPSEQLMAGCLYGGQSMVFSKERAYYLYPHPTDLSIVTAAPTQCKRGLVNIWGLAVGIGGIYFIAKDGIYRTQGGPEDWLSRKIDPLFRGQTKNGMLPIDMTATTALRLEIHENELYFQYQDTGGTRRCLVYSIPYQYWRAYTYGVGTSVLYSDEGNTNSTLLMGGATTGKSYVASGFSDDGSAISWQARTGAITFGRPREEKRMGDQAMDADSQGVAITLQNLIDNETVANTAQVLSSAPGRRRSIFDGFGTIPQRVKDISTDLTGSSATAAPVLYWLGTSAIIEPDITVNRVTQWEDLNHPDDSWVTGVTFDCDTGAVNRTIIVEGDYGGAIVTLATLTVNCDGRHKIKFTWPGQRVNKVRIRPNDDCKAWQLFKVDWIFQTEPPMIAGWDIHWENAWDQYYTGVDLYCDTLGQNKTVQVFVDETLIKTETVNTNGRKVWHITLPWGRGHVFRIVATDANPGQLYEYRWHTQPEPSEQTNWNQNFTVAGMESDKFLKAIIFQCDTFGQDKTVTVECDGVVVETLTVNASGRKVVELAFPQHLGRVFRVYPTDNFPGRLYSLWWVFDQEPLALTRWETQEITHGLAAWHYPIYAHITVKSVADVTLTMTAYNQVGVATTLTYTIPSTAGIKQKCFVPFQAMKGILFKYVLTSASAFWLYREETVVAVRPWGGDQTSFTQPFGNDDTDATRVMTRSEAAAARSGGSTG